MKEILMQNKEHPVVEKSKKILLKMNVNEFL